MAISGRFEADFASFYEACRLAQVSVQKFEGDVKEAENQVNQMVDSFSGRQIVTEATVMADAVGKIGGPARLTQQELRRVGQVADEAIEKMNRWGETPPRNLLRLSDAARQTRSSFSEAAGQVREVDNVLDLFGVHLGPARKALDDIGFAAENGADKLGFVGTAGLALGAAIGGWQIGRAISEFAGLDEKIGNVAAHLLGLPSVAEQAAAATADAIAKANKAHPELGGLVKTGETAQLLNQLDAQAQEAINKQASDIADRVNAVSRVAEEIKKVMDEVDAVRKSGVWDDLTKQINSHTVSLTDLAKEYHITDEAMNILAKDAQRIASIEENNARKLVDLRNQLQQAQIEREKQAAAEAEKARLAREAETHAAYQAAQSRHEQNIAEIDAQVAALHATQEETAALEAQRWQALQTASTLKSISQDYDLSTAEGRADFLRKNTGATISAPPDYFKTHSLADAVRDGLVSFFGGSGAGGDLSGRGTQAPPPGAGYGGYSSGYASPPGGGLPPAGTGFGGSTGGRGGPAPVPTVYAPVFVSGVFDPGTASKMGSVVSSAIWNKVRTSRRMSWP